MSTVGPTVERENPARTHEVVGMYRPAKEREVAGWVGAAQEAQAAWRDLDVEVRASALREAAARLRPELDEIAEVTSRETGKVLADCRGEAGFAAAVLEHYADRAEAVLADRRVEEPGGSRMLLRHRPYGVVAAVTPWNAPLVLTMIKLAPALAAGNAIVVKPSPLAPFGVSRMLRAVAGALPGGLVGAVLGDADVATALVGNPGVHRVAFTGGDTAGREIAALAGRALTPSVLELGGNDPAILLPDAELTDDEMDRLVMATFATSGQVCMAVKRIYAPRERCDAVAEAFRAAADRVLHLGDPLHEGVTVGPVVTAASAARVTGLLDDARRGGARVFTLGTVDPATDLTRGYYVRPSLAVGARHEAPLVTCEQFGPAVPLLPYDTVDEAVQLANSGELGLAASVWSPDEDRAFAVARRLDAGFTFVNTHNRTGIALHLPFGGVKRSGWGREYGDDGLLEYVQPCVVHAPGAFRAGGTGLGASAYPLGR